ncbi:hypothetical protein GM51_19175, partial [freshwater metagenome]
MQLVSNITTEHRQFLAGDWDMWRSKLVFRHQTRETLGLHRQ